MLCEHNQLELTQAAASWPQALPEQPKTRLQNNGTKTNMKVSGVPASPN